MMEKVRIAMPPEAWKGSKIENPHCDSKEVDDRCCSCRCGNDGHAAKRRATDTPTVYCTSLPFLSCLVLFQATSRHAFPLCLLLVFVCLYLYPSRTHGIASRGSVYVFFRVEMPCYLCMSVNAIPLPYTLSLHGSHEFTTYNIPHHTGQASSPANKDKTILQRMIDNWEDELYSGDTCRTFTSELP